jgi:hypothetical protein
VNLNINKLAYQVKYYLSFFSIIALKTPFSRIINSSGVSNYKTPLSPNTRILSEFFKVEILCAIVRTVFEENCSFSTCWINSSFLTSIFAVASSIRTISVLFRNALHMDSNCFYPMERLSPPILLEIPPLSAIIA